MKISIISYSLTGNNAALAKSIAAELGAEHLQITEVKPRNIVTIILDMLLNRTPRINPVANHRHNLVFLVGPVWMGQVATPFRAYFKHFKTKLNQYVFISLSGGALGPNLKLREELKKRIGIEPLALLDLHIADLLPPEPKPTTKDTGAYRLNDQDAANLTNTIVKTIQAIVTV